MFFTFFLLTFSIELEEKSRMSTQLDLVHPFGFIYNFFFKRRVFC
jgi:hypothetical protein